MDRMSVLSSQNGWSRVADPMFMIGDYSWQAEIETVPGEPFEFMLCADGAWDRQWGAEPSEKGEGSIPASGSMELTAAPMGSLIRLPPREGGYRIVFDEHLEKIVIDRMGAEDFPTPVPIPPPHPAPSSARSDLEWAMGAESSPPPR